ncbi:MAG TPA: adenylyl-sulfate kinase [bacterium]|nr:adenylyl-sulfate kinase [bacterium]
MSDQQGLVIWLTGMSGTGKTTLAQALAQALPARGAARMQLLDGDELRQTLCRGLGFSRADRDENIQRLGYVAQLLERHGVAVIVAAISPYRETRAAVQATLTRCLEVQCTAPLTVLQQRDVKGLYAQAAAGELPQFTGVSDPYEPATAPAVTVDSSAETVAAGVDKVLAALTARGWLAGDAGLTTAEEELVRQRLADLGYL